MKLSDIFTRKKIDHNVYLIGCILFPLYTLYWCATHFDVASILGLYAVIALGGLSISLFVHRCWSHRSWQPTVQWLNIVGLFCYTIQFCGPHIGWVATHRKHHRLEDTEEDPHSPYYMSRWKILFWPRVQLDYTYITDIMKDPVHVWFATHYWHINIAWWIVLYAINPAALAFWFAFIGGAGFKMRLINSIGHADPVNKSTNNRPIFAYIYLDGEPWHDNHSKNPRDWQIGKTWWQIDFGNYFIQAFCKLGWGKTNDGWRRK